MIVTRHPSVIKIQPLFSHIYIMDFRVCRTVTSIENKPSLLEVLVSKRCYLESTKEIGNGNRTHAKRIHQIIASLLLSSNVTIFTCSYGNLIVVFRGTRCYSNASSKLGSMAKMHSRRSFST